MLCPLLARHDVLLDLHSFQAQSEPFAMLGPVNNAGPLEPFALAALEQALVLRLGVGRITVADCDLFETSNLNRQTLATSRYLHRPKTEAALARAQEVNPSVSLRAVRGFLDEDAMAELFDGADLALDALGGMASRRPLLRAAARAGVPVVSGGLAGWTGWIAVVDPGRQGPADFMAGDEAENRLGCPAPTVQAVAALMARETASLLASGESKLAGRMLVLDLQDMRFESLAFGQG